MAKQPTIKQDGFHTEANRKACEWYENQEGDKRRALQDEFGNKGVADREVKFYSWLVQNKERLNIEIK